MNDPDDGWNPHAHAFYDDAPMPNDDDEGCCHCGERLRNNDEIGECAHGICHAQCLLDAGCEIA